MRINEAFGDEVNWELIPTLAIASMDLVANNPAYGLNALGGALNVRMKDGFSYHGGKVDVSGGSYGRVQAGADYGQQIGAYAVYGALEYFHDDFYRYFSNTNVRRFYGDLGYRADGNEIDLNVNLANSGLGVPGTSPIQMLRSKLVADLYDAADHLQPDGHGQPHRTVHADPDLDAHRQRLCAPLRPNTRGRQPQRRPGLRRRRQFDLLWRRRHPRQQSFRDSKSRTPRSTMRARPTAAPTTSSARSTAPASRPPAWEPRSSSTTPTRIFGLKNNFSFGASFDYGMSSFAGSAELGVVQPNYVVQGSGIYLGESGDPVVNGPTSVHTINRYVGVYALDAFEVNDKLTLTGGARFNLASISLFDELGGTASGEHQYTHINPLIGFTYKITPNLQAYGSYAQSNRAPTPLELACADPLHPCVLASFLVADPNLQQVTAQTFEAGLRGQQDFGEDFGALIVETRGFLHPHQQRHLQCRGHPDDWLRLLHQCRRDPAPGR